MKAFRLFSALAVTIFLYHTVNSKCSKKCVHFKGVDDIENMQDDDDYCMSGLYNGKNYYVKSGVEETTYLFFDADDKSWKVSADLGSEHYLATAHDAAAEDPTEISSSWTIGPHTEITNYVRFTEKTYVQSSIYDLHIDINCGRYNSTRLKWLIVGAVVGGPMGPTIIGLCIVLCRRKKKRARQAAAAAAARQAAEARVRDQPDPLFSLLAACSRDGRHATRASTHPGPLPSTDPGPLPPDGNQAVPGTSDNNPSTIAGAANNNTSDITGVANIADLPALSDAVWMDTVVHTPVAIEAWLRAMRCSVDEDAYKSTPSTKSSGERCTSNHGPSTSGKDFQSSTTSGGGQCTSHHGAATSGQDVQSTLVDDISSAGAGMPLQPLGPERETPEAQEQTDEDRVIAIGVSEGTGLGTSGGDEELLIV